MLLFLLIIVILFTFYHKQFVPFSHTSLGRFLAVAVIAHYSKINVFLGLFLCVAVILYYQTDDSKYMLNIPEGFLWDMTYTPYTNEMYEELHSELSIQFRQDHCLNGKLISKGIPVNVEMAEHAFPELKFTGSPCDPCNARCNFTILEKKLKTEEALIRGALPP